VDKSKTCLNEDCLFMSSIVCI